MMLKELDALWALRHLEDKRAEFNAAISQALDKEPGQIEWLWREARSRHFAAMLAADDGKPAGASHLFQNGGAIVWKSVQGNSDNVGALFWFACCILGTAQLPGHSAGLLPMYKARKRLDKAAELDPGFHYAGPLRVQGRIAQLAPSWVGGSVEKAIALQQRALELAPGHPTTMIYLAEALLDGGRPREARKLLEEVVAAPPFPDWIWEQERDRRQARSLLEGLPG